MEKRGKFADVRDELDRVKTVPTPVRTVKQPVERATRSVRTEVTEEVMPGGHVEPEPLNTSAPEIAAGRKKPQVHECPECSARHVRKLGLSPAEYMKEYRDSRDE
ncbi:hypothetical protein LCGC14_0879560 [marine sediment metagenome]|uniref:Uncharacterized protein n=1 Tax=marine sediment metagenome TaxID=412755 RepID=A0A0F9P787_9ZZZZ